MQIDGISSIPPIGSISSAQQLDGPTQRASYQRPRAANTRGDPFVGPLGPKARNAARSRSSSRPTEPSASDSLFLSQVDETDSVPGSILDEIA